MISVKNLFDNNDVKILIYPLFPNTYYTNW